MIEKASLASLFFSLLFGRMISLAAVVISLAAVVFSDGRFPLGRVVTE